MKVPTFYCENCGNPVSLKADYCPSCARRFESVKCPECGFTGKAGLFADGCPSCGFLSTEIPSVISDPGIEEYDLTASPPKRTAYVSGRQPEKRPLPAWVYATATIGLIGFLIFLLVIYYYVGLGDAIGIDAAPSVIERHQRIHEVLWRIKVMYILS